MGGIEKEKEVLLAGQNCSMRDVFIHARFMDTSGASSKLSSSTPCATNFSDRTPTIPSLYAPTPSNPPLAQNPQSALRLRSRLLNSRSSLIFIILPLPLMLILVIPHILRVDSLDLRGASPQQNRMTANVLPLHIPRRLEEFVSVAETDEAIAFTLRRSLVANNSCLLD